MIGIASDTPRSIWAMLLLAAICCFFSCRKAAVEVPLTDPEPVSTPLQSGLPERYDTLNGLMYAGYSYISTQNQNSYLLDLFAGFHDPGGDLLEAINITNSTFILWKANVSVGELRFNGTVLPQSKSGNSFCYFAENIAVYPQKTLAGAVWKAEGKTTYKPFEIKIEKDFPQFIDSLATFEAKLDSGLTLDCAQYFSNFDSVVVELKANFSNTRLKAVATPDSSLIYFSPAELSSFPPSSGHLIFITAFNYSHIVIENKKHIFILSKMMQKNLKAT